jgi:hypothetical protein
MDGEPEPGGPPLWRAVGGGNGPASTTQPRSPPGECPGGLACGLPRPARPATQSLGAAGVVRRGDRLDHGALEPRGLWREPPHQPATLLVDHTDSGPLFYDWSDGAVAHPFFELLTAPGTLRELDSHPEAAAHYRRIYLEAWRDFGSMERLEEAFALSQKLLPCYHTLSYYWIIQNTEPAARWELGGGLSYFLGRLLQKFGGGGNEMNPAG